MALVNGKLDQKETSLERLRLRLFGPRQHRLKLADFGIEWIFVELTNQCNMHCKFCPSDSLKRKRAFMKFSMFKRVIDELAELAPPNPIALHVLGEPMLHPEFFKCLDYCAEKKLRVYLFSNGLIAERKIAEVCKRDHVEALVLSIQTPTPESFKLRGINISYEKYWQSNLNAIRYTVEHGANAKMRVEVHMANTSHLPYRDWRVFEDHASARNVFRDMARELKKIDRAARNEPCDDETIERLLDEDFTKIPEQLLDTREWNYWGYEAIPNVFLRLKHFGTFGAYEAILPGNVYIQERTEPSTCEIADNNLCVLTDGTLTACCVDVEGETRIGHMNQRGIYLALHSERRARLREDVTRVEVCRRCMGGTFFKA